MNIDHITDGLTREVAGVLWQQYHTKLAELSDIVTFISFDDPLSCGSNEFLAAKRAMTKAVEPLLEAKAKDMVGSKLYNALKEIVVNDKRK